MRKFGLFARTVSSLARFEPAYSLIEGVERIWGTCRQFYDNKVAKQIIFFIGNVIFKMMPLHSNVYASSVVLYEPADKDLDL